MRVQQGCFALLAVLALQPGCSPRDPVDTTPSYHVGTPTNRSTVYSWQLNREPYNTQPGVYRGKPVHLPTMPSQQGLDTDSLAQAVYSAIAMDGGVRMKYLSSEEDHGIVLLSGTVPTALERSRAIAIARGVRGVRKVHSEIELPGAAPL